MWANPNQTLAPGPHAFDAVLETRNDSTITNAERVLLGVFNTVAAVQKEAVLDLNGASTIGKGSGAHLKVFVLDATTTPFHKAA
jgi:hypothetical protein